MRLALGPMDSDGGANGVQEFVTCAALRPQMGAVIKFDYCNDAGAEAVTQDEINMLLCEPAAIGRLQRWSGHRTTSASRVFIEMANSPATARRSTR